MKRVLLGTTALIGFIATPAYAQLDLAITGSVDVHAGFASEDLDLNRRDYGITTDTTLNFNTAGVADNGLEYGSRINVDDTSGDAFKIDETWIYVSGTFGELRFGATDPAASELRYAVPTVGNGQSDGDFGRYVNPNTDGEFAFGTDFLYDGDDNKIVYIGEFGGFTGGVSYSPSSASVGSDPAQQEDATEINIDVDLVTGIVTFEFGFEVEDAISVGGNYKGEFGNTSVGVSAGFNTADIQRGNITGSVVGIVLPLGTIPGGDLTEFGGGGEIGFGAMTVGGFYIASEIDIDTIGTIDVDRYGGGASFTTGPWGFAVNALLAEADFGGGFEIEDTIYGVGVEYSLADGLTPYADLVFFDHEALLDPTFDNDGSVFLAGVTASF